MAAQFGKLSFSRPQETYVPLPFQEIESAFRGYQNRYDESLKRVTDQRSMLLSYETDPSEREMYDEFAAEAINDFDKMLDEYDGNYANRDFVRNYSKRLEKFISDPRLDVFAHNKGAKAAEREMRRKLGEKYLPMGTTDPDSHKAVFYDENGEMQLSYYHPESQERLDWEGRMNSIMSVIKESASQDFKGITGADIEGFKNMTDAELYTFLETGTRKGVQIVKDRQLLNDVIDEFTKSPEGQQMLKHLERDKGMLTPSEREAEIRKRIKAAAHKFEHGSYLRNFTPLSTPSKESSRRSRGSKFDDEIFGDVIKKPAVNIADDEINKFADQGDEGVKVDTKRDSRFWTAVRGAVDFNVARITEGLSRIANLGGAVKLEPDDVYGPEIGLKTLSSYVSDKLDDMTQDRYKKASERIEYYRSDDFINDDIIDYAEKSKYGETAKRTLDRKMHRFENNVRFGFDGIGSTASLQEKQQVLNNAMIDNVIGEEYMKENPKAAEALLNLVDLSKYSGDELKKIQNNDLEPVYARMASDDILPSLHALETARIIEQNVNVENEFLAVNSEGQSPENEARIKTRENNIKNNSLSIMALSKDGSPVNLRTAIHEQLKDLKQFKRSGYELDEYGEKWEIEDVEWTGQYLKHTNPYYKNPLEVRVKIRRIIDGDPKEGTYLPDNIIIREPISTEDLDKRDLEEEKLEQEMFMKNIQSESPYNLYSSNNGTYISVHKYTDLETGRPVGINDFMGLPLIKDATGSFSDPDNILYVGRGSSISQETLSKNQELVEDLGQLLDELTQNKIEQSRLKSSDTEALKELKLEEEALANEYNYKLFNLQQ